MMEIHLADRMPAVAAGSERWSAEEAAHLTTCAACSAEWRLVQATRRLGQDVASGLDAEALAASVVARLRTPAPRPGADWRRWWWAPTLAAAAGLILVLWPSQADGPGGAASPDTAEVPRQFALGLPALDSLDTAELQLVLETMVPPIAELSPPGDPGLGDLNEQELERVLRAGEG